MNKLFVKSTPSGDFVEVSASNKNWLAKLQPLISQKRQIKFDFYPLSCIPEQIQNQLKQEGYQDFTLESDQWQHFFIPTPDATHTDNRTETE